jgi:2-methylcitrate dehydratase PrpD
MSPNSQKCLSPQDNADIPEERHMTVALDLARNINTLRYDRLPKQAIGWAKMAMIDTIGAALAGAREPCTKIVEQVTRLDKTGGGACLVFGGSKRARALDATLINGTAAHAIDYDDTSKTMSGHPSAVIVPAIIALGEEINSDGQSIIEAYVAGFETGTGIGRGVNFHHYEKGWHPTATLGIFGAAAACARLLKLSDEQLATALSIGVSLSAGVKANFGSMTKPLHAGTAARNGLFAALLAQDGFTASGDAFEQSQGFFEVFNGSGNYDANKITSNWGNPLDIIKPGISIKQYPCVYSVHAAVDAAILLRNQSALKYEQIATVEVCMHRRRLLPHTMKPATSGLNAKFSLPYIIARALMDGRLTIEHFEGDAYAEPAVQALMGKIVTKPHFDDNKDYSGTVTVTLKDGTKRSESVVSPRGRGPENPLSDEDLKLKFQNCASRLLPAAKIESVYDKLSILEKLDSIREITTIIEMAIS